VWNHRYTVTYTQYWRKVKIHVELSGPHSVTLFADAPDYWLFLWGWRNWLMPITEKGQQKIVDTVGKLLLQQGVTVEWNTRSNQRQPDLPSRT
jgi:hypothetical protein